MWFIKKSDKRRKSNTRRLTAERLEYRSLMAADVMHNFLMPHDVNDDGNISPIDVLVVVNRINGTASTSDTSATFGDVDDDSSVSPLDALAVINRINSRSSSQESFERSHLVGTNGAMASIEVESENGEVELSIRLKNAPPSSTHDVTLNAIALGTLETDAQGRGRLVLSLGDDHDGRPPIPDGLLPLRDDMELVIGSILRGTIGDLSGGGTGDDDSSGGGSDDSSNNDDDSSSNQGELHLAASFPVVNQVKRSAEFERESEDGSQKYKLKIEIESNIPESTFEVAIDGQILATVTTDQKGKGVVRFSSAPRDSREQVLPPEFFTIDEGSEVRIGDLTATFKIVT